MPFKTIREFIQLETSGGIILFTAAVLALIISNTPLNVYYHHLFNLSLNIKLGDLTISKSLLMWINDGLMTIFFLLVGLEIKRELFEGELSSLQKAALPAIAAIGGMVIPALIYYLLNKNNVVALQGWAIPTATDIAFSLGILSLLGSRIPISLKVFLTAIAIFDDIGAIIIIIATFYTKNISLHLLLISLGLIVVLFLLNRFRVTRLWPYIVVGLMLWVCVFQSGVHATLAGVILAFAIPLRNRQYSGVSPLRWLEHQLHPWVAFGVLPLFAFANAGISLTGITSVHLSSPIFLGIVLGLFFGKQIGIGLATFFSLLLGIAEMPKQTTYLGIYGVSLIAGVGFTMSLFIGVLAFGTQGGYDATVVRLGVISGSLLSGIFGYLILRIFTIEKI